jgi:hypothetical protein
MILSVGGTFPPLLKMIITLSLFFLCVCHSQRFPDLLRKFLTFLIRKGVGGKAKLLKRLRDSYVQNRFSDNGNKIP